MHQALAQSAARSAPRPTNLPLDPSVALGATDPQEAVFEPAALQVGRELLLHEGGQAALVARWRLSRQAPGRLWQGFHRASLQMPGRARPVANPGTTC